MNTPTFEIDPFPEAEPAPLTSEALEAAAVRVAVCSPEHARGLDPDRDLTFRALREIARAAMANHERGEPWDTGWLFKIEGNGVPWQLAVEAYLDHSLDVRGMANPAAIRECRRLSTWRTLRENLLRAAIACELMDVGALVASLDAANAITSRMKTARAA